MDAEIYAASNTGTILSASNNAASITFIGMAASNNVVPLYQILMNTINVLQEAYNATLPIRRQKVRIFWHEIGCRDLNFDAIRI